MQKTIELVGLWDALEKQAAGAFDLSKIKWDVDTSSQDVVSRIANGYSSPTPVQGNDAGRLINAVREANGMGPVDLNRTGTPVDNL